MSALPTPPLALPTSAAAPGHDLGAESVRMAAVLRLRALDRRLAAALWLVAGSLLLLALVVTCVQAVLPTALSWSCRSAQQEVAERVQELWAREVDRQVRVPGFLPSDPGFVDDAQAPELWSGTAPGGRYRMFVHPRDRRGTFLPDEGPGEPRGFGVVAVGVGGMTGDLWTMLDGEGLQNLRDVCAR